MFSKIFEVSSFDSSKILGQAHCSGVWLKPKLTGRLIFFLRILAMVWVCEYVNYSYLISGEKLWRHQFYILWLCCQQAGAVKPVLRDHCHERPPVLKDQVFLAEGAKFQCNWTSYQRPPVLWDHSFMANDVVFPDRFYCTVQEAEVKDVHKDKHGTCLLHVRTCSDMSGMLLNTKSLV